MVAIVVLAAGTYAFRIAGPVFHGRLRIPVRVRRLLSVAAVILLVALAVTAAVTAGHGFAGFARPAGVLVGGLLAVRRAPFPVIVVAAMATAALLRLLGVR